MAGEHYETATKERLLDRCARRRRLRYFRGRRPPGQSQLASHPGSDTGERGKFILRDEEHLPDDRQV